MKCVMVSFGVACGIFLCLPACSTGPVVSQMIVDDPTRMVRVDVTYRTGNEEHSHPADLSDQEVNRALQLILVVPSSLLPATLMGGDRDVQAFSREEREFLVPPTVQALSRATPLEEVVFFWVHSRDPNIREVTSGSIFVQGEELHVIVANFRQTTSNQGMVDRARRNPLTVLGQTLYYLETSPGAHLVSGSLWDKWFSQPRQHLVIPWKSVSTPAVDPEENIGSPSQSPHRLPSTLRHKLNELLELRNEGLISEQEYQSKRRELLEQY